MATETRTPPAAAPAATAAHYRPQLDGLRAIAVYLVVAYHAGIQRFSGGFIGVDLFFVLSGYLVTQLLLRDFRSSDRVGFRRFYSRRFRRLLPAAFVALLVTAAVYTAVAAPTDVANARGGFRSAFLYVANWHFIAQSNDYFAANVNTNPVVHFWSLAVEEQFYLVWPLLLSGLYLVAKRFGDRRWKIVRLAMFAGFVASLVAALHLSHVNLNRAYYGTDTRAYELLAGALLAITPRVVRSARRRAAAMGVIAVVALIALLLVASSNVHLGEIQRGLAATIVTCALIVALEASKHGVVTRALSTPSAVYLGRVSYGTYLWHWPVIVIASQRFHPNSISMFAIACLLATGLASLSYQILEQRVRLSRLLDRFRGPVIAIGLATSLVGGIVLIPAITNYGRASGASAATGIGTVANGLDTRVPVPKGLDLEAVAAAKYGRPQCYQEPVDKCVIIGTSGPRVLLIGDSHAQSLIRAFVGIAHTYKLTLAIVTYPNCPWEQGVVELPIGHPTDLASVCRAHQADWYQRVVPQWKPDIVVLAHRTLDDPLVPSVVGFPDGRKLRSDAPDYRGEIDAAVDHTIGELRENGRKIVIVEPMPTAAGLNPFTCLSTAKYLDQCRYVADPNPTPLEKHFRKIANGRDVFSIDLDRLVCPYLPICDPIVGGVVVKKDPQHITAPFSATMAGPIGKLLVEDGVISPP